MNLENHTPFNGLSWQNMDPDNQTFVTTLCRVKFILKKSKEAGEWELQPDKDQGELFIKDEHYENNIESSVRYESDLVPLKAHTDFVVNAKSYNVRSEPNWSCSVALYDSDGAQLLYSALDIKNSAFREKPHYVNIRYEGCAGGLKSLKNPHTKDEIREYDLYNPVGCGKYTEHDCRVQIDYADGPLSNIPAGFGFIHRSWKSRLDYAGTYDSFWEEEQAPLLPKDFDPYYYQSAHPKLITKDYLKGGEKVVLTQLMPSNYRNTFALPSLKFLSRVHTSTQVIPRRMNLDTVVVDIYDEDIEAYRVYMTWRSRVKIYDEGLYSELIYVPNKEKRNVK